MKFKKLTYSLMKLISILSFCSTVLLWSTPSLAKQKVVLLTSLNIKNKFSWFCHTDYYLHYIYKLEAIFRGNFLYSKYDIEVIHNADQADLWNTLHDARNIAVFWVSHAGALPRAQQDPFFGFHRVIDAQGFDVQPIFQKIHPNLRFLGVIGCNSKDVMQSLPDLVHTQDRHPNYQNLMMTTFAGKVDAKKGLKTALLDANKVLATGRYHSGYPADCRKVSGYTIKVDRSFVFPRDLCDFNRKHALMHPAARIMAGNEVIGVFPSRQRGELKQSVDFFVPIRNEADADIELPQLRIDAGDNTQILSQKKLMQRFDLGILHLFLTSKQAPFLEPWHLRHDHLKRPIAILLNSYEVSPEMIQGVDVSTYRTEESEFSCDPMPAYY